MAHRLLVELSERSRGGGFTVRVDLTPRVGVFVAAGAALFAVMAAGSASADTYEKTPPAISVPAPEATPPPPAPVEQPKKRMRYVPNIGQPIFNEPAQITTEIRPIYIYHEIPNGFPSNGGHANAVAVQLRAAITDRLGFIATKDGWMDIDFDDTLTDEDGFLNIAAGLKYAVISKPEDDTFLSLGLRYEAPTGNLGLPLGHRPAGERRRHDRRLRHWLDHDRRKRSGSKPSSATTARSIRARTARSCTRTPRRLRDREEPLRRPRAEHDRDRRQRRRDQHRQFRRRRCLQLRQRRLSTRSSRSRSAPVTG